jgi:SAM-dependent methyltransferase
VDPKRVIRDGYDRLGPRFEAWAEAGTGSGWRAFVANALSSVPPGGLVVELGCGSGRAIDALSAGRSYIGVDLSARQLELARSRARGARLVRGDLTTIALRRSSVDAVVALYVFNHVPRAELGPTLRGIAAWLRPGGCLALSMGSSDTEDAIEERWLGVPMFFAGFAPPTNERLIGEAGLTIERSDVLTEDEEGYGPATFHWVIARKPGDGER